jgi:hypothetical protein
MPNCRSSLRQHLGEQHLDQDLARTTSSFLSALLDHVVVRGVARMRREFVSLSR